MVGLAQQEELQRRHGGQAVVDIIEGQLIDVQLALPARAPAIEGQAVKVDPGAVFLFQTEPDVVALVGRQGGVLVHDVLELVHFAPVRQEDQALLGVGQGVLGGIGPEQQFVPGSGQKLHGHRVDLSALHTGALEVLGDGVVPGGQIALEGVAGLVGQHVHIAGGVVPVGKDEGGLVVGQDGHIAAVGLAGPAQDVEQLVVLHKVDERGRLGAQLMVHGAGGVHPHLVALDRHGVAVRERHVQVREGGVLDAGAFGAAGHDLGQQGHHVPGHLIPKDANLLGAVADPVHPRIGQLAVVVVAQNGRLPVQVLDGALIQLVELGAVGVKVAGFGLKGGPADGGVQALLIGSQLGDGQLLAVQLHQRAAVQPLVQAGNGVGLLLQGGDAAVHREDGVAHPRHAGGAEGFGQGVQMGVGQNGPVDFHLGAGHGRAVLVEKVLLGLPVGVAGIAGVVDVGEVGGGAERAHGGALVVVDLGQGLAGGGGSRVGGKLPALGQDGVDVGACVGHFTELHSGDSPSCSYPESRMPHDTYSIPRKCEKRKRLPPLARKNESPRLHRVARWWAGALLA